MCKENKARDMLSAAHARRVYAAFLSALFAVFVLTACTLPMLSGPIGNTAATEQPVMMTTKPAPSRYANRLEKILAMRELVVATCPDFAPMEFIDNRNAGQGQYVGMDMWFAKYIADELNVNLTILAADFDSLQAEVNEGRADLALSGLAYTEKRADESELSDFYNNIINNKPGLIILKSSLSKYVKADDFKGKTVAVQEATTQYSLLTEQLPGAIPKPINSVDDGVMMLLTKEVDALGADEANGQSICENYPDLAMSVFKYEYEPQGNVIAMPKGEHELCERINEIIAKAESEGRFAIWIEDAEALAEEIGWQN